VHLPLGTRVQVSVVGRHGKILVSVQDDGSGFDPQRVRGLGLLGMEERVRHLGGSFEIDSQPGCGTLLRVALPLATIPEGRASEQTEPAAVEEKPGAVLLWDGGRLDGADSHSAG